LGGGLGGSFNYNGHGHYNEANNQSPPPGGFAGGQFSNHNHSLA
jgi:hypothetical protein